jgi:small subunit ribosomal protein S17
MSAATAPVRGKRKAKVGRVVSDKMDKTIVVSVERLARHRMYKRVIRLTTKFKAHDEHNEAHVGDTVRIEEARPLSATKRWRLAEVVTRAGIGAGETVVSEEPATAEAIHMAAHPGRDAAADDAATSEAAADDAATSKAAADDAATSEAVGDAPTTADATDDAMTEAAPAADGEETSA